MHETEQMVMYAYNANNHSIQYQHVASAKWKPTVGVAFAAETVVDWVDVGLVSTMLLPIIYVFPFYAILLTILYCC